MMKYSDIHSLEALDSAMETLAVRIEHKEKELVNRYERAKDSYTPNAMTAFALRNASSFIPFDRIALSLVRRALHVFGR